MKVRILFGNGKLCKLYEPFIPSAVALFNLRRAYKARYGVQNERSALCCKEFLLTEKCNKNIDVSRSQLFCQKPFLWLLGWLWFKQLLDFSAAFGSYVIKTKQEKQNWKQKAGQDLAQDEEVVIRARLRDLPSLVSSF